MKVTHFVANACAMRAAILLAMLLAAASAQAQSAFKCVEGGKTVYKDQPCMGSHGTVADDVGRRNEALAETANEAKKKEERMRVARAAQLKYVQQRQKECGPQWEAQPAVGMTGSWVRRCSDWGEPRTVNKTSTARGTQAQWVYPSYGFIYVNEDDIVTTIQTKSGR